MKQNTNEQENKTKGRSIEEAKNNNGNTNGQNGIFNRLKRNPLIVAIIFLVIVGGIAGGVLYWMTLQSRVYIDKSEINAPIISIASAVPGVLEKVRVEEGDVVGKGKVVAIVGTQQLETKTRGIIIYVENTPGQIVNSQTPVVKMIDPEELRVIGRIEEDKGLKYIKVGQKVTFTVDAFGSDEYEGIVESIAPSSRESDIVFSISDKRQQKEFEIKVKFDYGKYPEIKNGMSAKMWVYK